MAPCHNHWNFGLPLKLVSPRFMHSTLSYGPKRKGPPSMEKGVSDMISIFYFIFRVNMGNCAHSSITFNFTALHRSWKRPWKFHGWGASFSNRIDLNPFTHSLRWRQTFSLYKTLNFLTPERVQRAFCALKSIFQVLFTILTHLFVPQMENF